MVTSSNTISAGTRGSRSSSSGPLPTSPTTCRPGASGYLTKDHSPEELTEAIRRVYRGNKYVSPGLAERLASDLAAGTRDDRHELLSDREYEVLCLLGSGRTVKEISHSLRLSPKTVSTYRTRVLDKMGASSNADLVRYAALHGLIS